MSLALPTRPVPAMFDFIATSAEYINDTGELSDRAIASLSDWF